WELERLLRLGCNSLARVNPTTLAEEPNERNHCILPGPVAVARKNFRLPGRTAGGLSEPKATGKDFFNQAAQPTPVASADRRHHPQADRSLGQGMEAAPAGAAQQGRLIDKAGAADYPCVLIPDRDQVLSVHARLSPRPQGGVEVSVLTPFRGVAIHVE